MSPFSFFWIVAFFTFLIALVLGSSKTSSTRIRPDGRMDGPGIYHPPIYYPPPESSSLRSLLLLCLVSAIVIAILSTMLVFG